MPETTGDEAVNKTDKVFAHREKPQPCAWLPFQSSSEEDRPLSEYEQTMSL